MTAAGQRRSRQAEERKPRPAWPGNASDAAALPADPIAPPPGVEADQVLRALADGGRLIHLAQLPARQARPGSLAHPLDQAIAERLPATLWSHQAEAIDLARARRSVVVATGTASGKSLCFQVPIAEAVSYADRAGTRPCSCTRPRPWLMISSGP